MTAREKFIERLKEEGLYEDWLDSGDKAAKFLEDGSILLFIHYEWEPDDEYNEILFPPFNEMRDVAGFRKECATFFDNYDDKFVASLGRWLHYAQKECPLDPVDAYFPGNGLEQKVITFKDDEDEKKERVSRAAIDILRLISELSGVRLTGKINGKDFDTEPSKEAIEL